MKNHSKRCWSCGSREMKPLESFFQCLSCGATWNEQPAEGHDPVTMVDAETGGPPRHGHNTEYRAAAAAPEEGSKTSARKRTRADGTEAGRMAGPEEGLPYRR